MIRQPLVSPIIKYDGEGKEIEHKVHPENKQYLLLLYFKDDTKTFEVITGRTETYNYIKNTIFDYDLDKCQILVEGQKLETCKTVRAFMKHMENYFDDGFNIDDYDEPEVETEEEIKYDDSDRPVSISNFIKDTDTEDL